MKKLNVKDIGLRLALAGIGTALSLVCVTLSYYLSFMSLSFMVLSCVGVMCPLCKKFYREGILCSIAVSVIGFFIVNVHIVPFIMASGFYVVLTVFLHEKKVNTLILFFVKLVYSCLVFFVIYWAIDVLVVDVTKITFLASFNEIGLYAILNVAFSLCFLVYDVLLIQGYKYACNLADKIIKPRQK